MAAAVESAAEAAAPPVDAAEWEPSDSDEEHPHDVLESQLCGEYSYGAQRAPNTGGSLQLSHRAKNDVQKAQRGAEREPNEKGREARATSEQVLDPRTRLILHKLLGRKVFAKLEGCLSTGKEANVYYAKAGEGVEELRGEAGAALPVASGDDLAVKVFKTSILVFRDRQRYVDGEHRFRRGYTSGRNPRKMVTLWAEKELRNYKRLISCGVRAPRPVLLKGHVLVMEFVGADGWPAPRLHDWDASEEEVQDAYWQTCVAMRQMYARCKLVHGDLSEYNLLWYEARVWVIDVSQSVEMDHPRALEFLRKDCANINEFFGRSCRHPVAALSVKQLFDFVTDKDSGTTDEAIDAALQRAQEMADAGDAEAAKADDAVFMDAFLPRSLHDLGANPEKAQRLVAGGENEACFDEAVAGLLAAKVVDESDAESEATAEELEEAEGAAGRLPDNADDRARAKELKREAARKQKEAAREKRKVKVPKHVKKKATKKGR